MSKRQGQRLQGMGCVLILTVMLVDHFLFSIQESFILAAAGLSAALLIAGIRMVKLAEIRQEQAGQNP